MILPESNPEAMVPLPAQSDRPSSSGGGSTAPQPSHPSADSDSEAVASSNHRRSSRLPVVVIEPQRGWHLFNWRELLNYRDLLYFLVLRDVTVLYKQTILGLAWAILNPFLNMVVFTVIFGMLLKVPSDGKPYALFSFAALLPWTYFSQSLTSSTNSLIQGVNLFTKVYFPRVLMPLVAVFSKLLDFSIALLFLVAMLIYYRVMPSWNVVYLPLLIILMMLTSAGVGMGLSALAIQYRDIRHAMQFVVQILMYAAPVVWPVSKLPDELRLWYGLYPLAGVIEGFRCAILSTGPMPWDLIGMGSITAIISFLAGALYFRRTERFFADVA